MGLCASYNMSPAQRAELDEERIRNLAIETANAIDHEQDLQVRKLLFLGKGESGKSELFKQFINLYGTGFTDKQITDFTRELHTSTLTAMQQLCTNVRLFNECKL